MSPSRTNRIVEPPSKRNRAIAAGSAGPHSSPEPIRNPAPVSDSDSTDSVVAASHAFDNALAELASPTSGEEFHSERPSGVDAIGLEPVETEETLVCDDSSTTTAAAPLTHAHTHKDNGDDSRRTVGLSRPILDHHHHPTIMTALSNLSAPSGESRSPTGSLGPASGPASVPAIGPSSGSAALGGAYSNGVPNGTALSSGNGAPNGSGNGYFNGARPVVHPTALVDISAVLGEDCRVGAYCTVGPNVRLGRGCVLEHHASVEGRPDTVTELGEGCRLGAYAYVAAGVRMGRHNVLHHHATVESDTLLGEANQIFPTAVIGGIPQDILYQPGQMSRLVIGDSNVFRECVTVNRGTWKENGLTRIGSRNWLLAGAHVGHDCIVEDSVILVNGVLLGGHCHIETGSIVNGATPLPPFLTVGRYAYVGGFSRITRDAPPFMIFQGIPPRVTGLNKVGLKRHGFSTEAIAALEQAWRLLFSPMRKQNMSTVIETLEAQCHLTAEVRVLLNFLRSSATGRDGRAREVLHQKWHPRDRE